MPKAEHDHTTPARPIVELSNPRKEVQDAGALRLAARRAVARRGGILRHHRSEGAAERSPFSVGSGAYASIMHERQTHSQTETVFGQEDR